MGLYLGKAGLALESVILAAGRGQRMAGLAKPFHKPLLELNGVSLVEHAITYASVAQAEHVTVVVSPSNADDITAIIKKYGGWVTTAVQDEPLGPGHAALVGLEHVDSERAMLLMSDNIMNKKVVAEMALHTVETGSDAIGVRHVGADLAARFTRIRVRPSGMLEYVEGTEVDDNDRWPGGNTVAVWCGPVFFNANTARGIFERKLLQLESGEMKIGTELSSIMSDRTALFDVEAFDVGVPSEYLEQRNAAQ